jgi:hypothetical protein
MTRLRRFGTAQPKSGTPRLAAHVSATPSPILGATDPVSSSTGPPDPAGASPSVSDLTALPKVLKIVGGVIAPTTLLSGLLFYFGRLYATGTFAYFDVNVTVLDLTVQDYLFRSVDGLLVPLVGLAGLVLLALWARHLIGSLPSRAEAVVSRIQLPLAAGAGAALVCVALADVVGGPVFPTHPELRGTYFALGVLLLAYAVHLLRGRLAGRRATRTTAEVMTEWGMLFVLVSVGLFWAAGSYANQVGVERARQIEAALPDFPTATLYSEKRLGLDPALAKETGCRPDGAYRYRYDGLKLLLRSGDQYVFVPVGWTRTKGSALLIRRADTLRLEFAPAHRPDPPAC